MALRHDPLRGAWNAVLDWIEERELARRLDNVVFVLLSGVVVATVATVLVVESSEPNVLGSSPRPDRERAGSVERITQSEIAYLNRTHGYRFAYPSTWDLRETEDLTQIESPSGGIVVSFRPGASGDLALASSRLLRSLAGLSDRQMIGVRRDRIDGHRSLLVSGVATDGTGRPVRFLTIAIRAEPRNYGISILVPRRSDPTRVLPRLEEIVSSFDVLDVEAQVVV